MKFELVSSAAFCNLATCCRVTSGKTLSVALWAVALGLSLGCGQDPPPDETSTGEYHPLVDGAWWEYAHSDWTERVTVESTTFQGEPAFLMSDSPNPSDQLRSDAILTKVDGRIARMTKDEYLIAASGDATLVSSVTYGVGFTRFHEAWASAPVGFQETPEYVRVETTPGGSPGPGEARRHTFEILSLSDRQVTPAGTFDCIQVRRTKDWQAEEDGLDADDAEAKVFWFARGVGKVREFNEDSGSSESLIAFEIPSLENGAP